jgi:outer membrane biosynthesis protein TonB
VSTPVIRTRQPRRSPARRRGGTRPREPKWVVTVILLSLLAHLLFVLAIVLVNRFLPPPKLKDQPLAVSSTTLSLEPAPPPAPSLSAPPKHVFMPTEEDKDAPHKDTLIESANDTRVKSQSQTARQPDSVMPDVTSKITHPANLKDAPNSPSRQPPHQAQQAAPAKQQQQSQPTPQKSQESTQHPQQSAEQTPPQPNAQPTKLPPTKTQSEKPATQPQQYDPNGLPVLPALNVPTMAPANQQRQEQASPAVSFPSVAQDSHGAIGARGLNSPEAMATELGKYKQRVYAAIGSYWYPAVDNQFSLLPVGVVHIQFVIHQDGSVSDLKILDGDTGNLQLLRSISQDSILKGAPYGPFTPGMIKEVGDSYTDDVSFSIYGQ